MVKKFWVYDLPFLRYWGQNLPILSHAFYTDVSDWCKWQMYVFSYVVLWAKFDGERIRTSQTFVLEI